MSVLELIIPSSLAQWMAKEWIKAFQRHPAATTVTTFSLVAIFGVLGIFAYQHDVRRQEEQRRQNLSYDAQLAELNKMENSLRGLTGFVGEQKAKLKESEDLISSLKQEQARLAPVVQADQQVVKAVLDLQEQRNLASARRERWIGFGIGVVSSVLASAICGIILFFWRRSNSGSA